MKNFSLVLLGMLAIAICDILLGLAFAPKSHAYEFTPAQASITQLLSLMNAQTTAATNSFTNFYNIENDDYHNFSLGATNTGSTTITNAGGVVLYYGIDSNIMTAFWTNGVSTTNSYSAYTNLVGKWKWLEVVLTVTNGNPQFLYLGGR